MALIESRLDGIGKYAFAGSYCVTLEIESSLATRASEDERDAVHVLLSRVQALYSALLPVTNLTTKRVFVEFFVNSCPVANSIMQMQP